MTKKRISTLINLATPDSLDLLPIVDVSEPLLENQTKKITVSNLLDASNPLLDKGDIYVHDGVISTRLVVGTNGQVLSANSAEIEGLEWIDPPDTSPLTSKGDLYTHDSSINIRLPIGTDGQILFADSVETSGLKWDSLPTDYLDVNSTGTEPNVTGINAIGIGQDSSSNNTNSIAIGTTAIVTADDAIQLGTGTNNTISTLQYLNNTLANTEGLYTNHTAINYTAIDADNITSHLSGIDTELNNKQNILPQSFIVNEETITTNKILNPSDEIFQYIKSDTSSLEVALPGSAINGTRFIIKNDITSTQSFDIIGGPSTTTLNVGDKYEVIYTGTQWIDI